MSQIFTLNRLQTVDSHLDKIQARLAEIEAILSNHQALAQAQAAHENAQQALDAAQRTLKAAEATLQSARSKKALNQQKLYSGRITNPKALQDLQDEAAALDRRIAALEDDLLEKMLHHESAEEAFQAADAALQRVREEIARTQTALLDEKARLEEEARRQNAQRERLRKQIEPSLLEKYDALRLSKNGLAVTRPDGQNCQACGAGLSPGLLQKARQENELVYCPTCKRILYAG